MDIQTPNASFFRGGKKEKSFLQLLEIYILGRGIWIQPKEVRHIIVGLRFLFLNHLIFLHSEDQIKLKKKKYHLIITTVRDKESLFSLVNIDNIVFVQVHIRKAMQRIKMHKACKNKDRLKGKGELRG